MHSQSDSEHELNHARPLCCHSSIFSFFLTLLFFTHIWLEVRSRSLSPELRRAQQTHHLKKQAQRNGSPAPLRVWEDTHRPPQLEQRHCDRPRRVGPRRVGSQNFALFFPSPATAFHFFSLSFGLFRGILVVFEAPALKCARLEFSGCRVKPRRPRSRKPSGFHTTTREPKRAHVRVPAFKNTTKIQRKGSTREGEKNKNCGGRRKKKSEILGGPAEGGRRRGAGGGALNTPTTHTQQQQHNNNTETHSNNTEQHNNTHTTNKQKQTTQNTDPHQNQPQHKRKMDWPKMDWPKLDWPKMDWPKWAKSGWPKRDWPKSVSSLPRPTSSGYVLSFLRRAATKATSSSAAPRWGSPFACKALTKVVSTASWAPAKSGSPSTTTSSLRASPAN